MKIKKIRIHKNYKRFHDLTIDLGENPKRIIALVGPNGCGKSSVLDGMVYHSSAHGQLGNTGVKNYLYHSMTGDITLNYQAIEIDFDKGNFQTVKEQKDSNGSGKTIFYLRSPYRYNAELKVQQSQATSELKLNDFGASTCADIDSKMDQNYRRLLAHFSRTYKAENLRYQEAKNKIIGELNASLKRCIDMEIHDIGDIEDGRGTLYFTKTDQIDEFEFNVLSSGEKEIVDIILDLYLRREVYNDTIFLIDEPELHLNTSIQKKLLLEINRIIDDDCQIWLATHSIGFLRALQTDLRDECSVIEFPKEMEPAKNVYTLSPMPMGFSDWRRVFSTALDDITHLVCPKQIIYCEGRDKPSGTGAERGLDAMVLNQVFGFDYPDTLFISSGGNTELDQRSTIAISILSKAVSGIEILVLKDRDVGSGKFMNLKDRKEYLETNDKNHHMLERLEIENYLFDKEVVEAYCKKKPIEFDANSYDAKISDIENEDVKSQVGLIKNLCEVTGSINPEMFKLSLAKCITSDMNIYKELQRCVFDAQS